MRWSEEVTYEEHKKLQMHYNIKHYTIKYKSSFQRCEPNHLEIRFLINQLSNLIGTDLTFEIVIIRQ